MDKIIDLYKKYGDSEYLGENVSKTVHMIQAAYAAEQNSEPDYIILACLLHDIGHFLEDDNMNGLGVIEHGKDAGDYLRKLNMCEKVCILVENHVMAKKYLVSKNKEYYNRLSDASKATLEFQGGKMTELEMRKFEKNEHFHEILRIRYYDDNGKKISVEIPKLNHYYNLINKFLYPNINQYKLDLNKKGYLLIKNFFTKEQIIKIQEFKKDLEKLEEKKGLWMIYYSNDLKSRIENFVNYNKNIKDFLDININPLLNNILDENMCLFKDKMNWKPGGGEGFKAHQDHPAWSDFNISRFYSVALFANESTIENGCLQFASMDNNNKIFNTNGCISLEVEESLNWEYIETNPSDLLIFDSFIPHRSALNKTSNPRSIFYFTYNKASEGDLYDDYIKNKRKHFPPRIERTCDINLDNNKYNLANPLN